MKILFVIILLWFSSRKGLALPDYITIAGIFDRHDLRPTLAFLDAVQMINSEPQILPTSKLREEIERLQADDSFRVSKTVCKLLRDGVAGIFGPQLENSANHVQSICNAMKIPHIETRWDYKLTRDSYSINLHPHPVTLSRAYFDVIKALNWKKFVLLYDENSGLIRLQTLLKMNDWVITIRHLKEDEDWRPLLKEMKFQENKFVVDVSSKNVLKILKEANEVGLINYYSSFFFTSLDMNVVDIEEFRYSGVNITALRLFDPNSPEIKSLQERIISYEKNFFRNKRQEITHITTEAVLMYDAVFLFAKALDDLHKSKVVEIPKLYCEGDKTWKHGSSLMHYMKRDSLQHYEDTEIYPPSPRSGGIGVSNYPTASGKAGMPSITRMQEFSGRTSNPWSPGMRVTNSMTSMGGLRGRMTATNPSARMKPNMRNHHDFSFGLTHRNMFPSYGYGMMNSNLTFENIYNQNNFYGYTGLIKFDADGFRTDVELEITEMNQKEGMKKVGIWTEAGGANFTRSLYESSESEGMTLENKTLIVISAINKPYTMKKNSSEHLVGNDQFEGFCVDLIEKIAEIEKFNYTFVLEPENSYGKLDQTTGEWDGMVKALMNREADLGIVDFTITYEREQAVDFSMPFMNLGIGIIYKKPTKKAQNLFSFMSPFSIDVWIYMATAYLGVSVLLFILARMSPSEWDSPYPCIQEPEELENCFTLQNSLWFIIATFLCQGADIAPRAVSTRIVAGIWWFFTLIMISSYTANLAAFLTAERLESPIEGAEDLAKQTKIKYGCKDGGSTWSFFRDSSIPTYQRMWSAMSNARPPVFTSSNDLGVDRVSNANGMYAFLMESVSIEYVIERRCELMKVGGLLDSKSYGIALPPGSPFTGRISSAVLKLKETGVIHTLKTKWWTDKGGGICEGDKTVDPAAAAELGLDNVGGVFVVMAGGGLIACFLACCEFIWKARKLAAEEGDSFWEELMKELRFIAKCSENAKPSRKPKSPETDSSTIYSSTNNYNYSKN